MLQDSAMILEEQPAKVAEAVKLFLQGLGKTKNVNNNSFPKINLDFFCRLHHSQRSKNKIRILSQHSSKETSKQTESAESGGSKC